MNWICNFLSNRTQYVKIGNSCSPSHPVLSGVPQGSVLGPVLFILYVNDICDLASPDVTIKLFADDAKLYFVFDSAICPDSLQSCLSAICVWSDHWQLALSPSKCSVLHITSGSTRNLCPHFVYRVGQSILPCVNCQSDLRVSYNNKLKFSPHINNIGTKAYLRAKLILKCLQSRDHLLLTKALCVFVRPLLEYCCVSWNPMYKQDITKIEAVQRRFTKRLSGL